MGLSFFQGSASLCVFVARESPSKIPLWGFPPKHTHTHGHLPAFDTTPTPRAPCNRSQANLSQLAFGGNGSISLGYGFGVPSGSIRWLRLGFAGRPCGSQVRAKWWSSTPCFHCWLSLGTAGRSSCCSFGTQIRTEYRKQV